MVYKIKSNKESIFWQTNRTIFFTLANTFLSIIFFGLAARDSEITFFGSQIIIVTAAGSIAGLVDFGSTYFHVRELSAGRISIRRVNDAFMTRTLSVAIIAFGCAAFSISNQKWNILYFVLLTSGQLTLQFVTIPLRAMGFTSILSQSLMIERAVSLVILGFVTHFYQNPRFALIMFFGMLTGIGYAIHRIRILQIDYARFSWKFHNPWKNTFAIGRLQILSQVQQLDLNLLAYLTNASIAAQYGAVCRWTSSLSVFSDSFSQAIMPAVSRKTLKLRELQEIKKSIFWLFMSIFVALVIAIFPQIFIKIILGSNYLDSVPILRLLALATIATTVTQPIATFLQAKNLTTGAFTSLVLGIFTQFLLIAILHDQLGAMAAALGYISGQCIAAVSLIYCLVKYVKH